MFGHFRLGCMLRMHSVMQGNVRNNVIAYISSPGRDVAWHCHLAYVFTRTGIWIEIISLCAGCYGRQQPAETNAGPWGAAVHRRDNP